MSKRKSEAVTQVTDISMLKGRDLPGWNDMLRGILVALVKERRAIWDSRFRAPKMRVIALLQEVASVLANQNKNMNEWSVLEKWCWLVEMYSRASSTETEWSWRYKGAMSFLSEFTGNGSQYLDCIPHERFVALTNIYAQEPEEKKVAQLPVLKKKKDPMFATEMTLYAEVMPLPGNDVSQAATNETATTSVTTVKEALISGFSEGRRRGRPRKANQANASPQRMDVDMPAAENSASTTPNTSPIKDGKTTHPISASNTPAQEQVDVKPQITTTSTSNTITSTTSPSKSNPAQVGKDPSVEDRVKAVLAMTNVTDAEWSHKAIQTLIDAVRARPELWHSRHPKYGDQALRQKLLLETLMALKKLPDSNKIDGDKMWKKWSDLRQIYEEIEKLMWKGEYVKWRYRQNLAFLSPQVMDACRFDDIPSTSTMAPTVSAQTTLADLFSGASSEIQPDANESLQKMIGLINDSGLISSIAVNQTPPVKRTRYSRRFSANKQDVEHETDQNQGKTGGVTKATVLSTWVPPREDTITTPSHPHHSSHHAGAPPMATAQIVSSTSLEPLLNTSTCSSSGSFSAALRTTPRLQTSSGIIEEPDKWTLIAKMMEQSGREIEKHSPVAAIHLQKEIHDLLYKYQLEALSTKSLNK